MKQLDFKHACIYGAAIGLVGGVLMDLFHLWPWN